MGAFEYRQAQEIRDSFNRHGVCYLFIGKSGAILLGFPDTTQDVDLFVERKVENCQALTIALREIGFTLTDQQTSEIEKGKDFVQLKLLILQRLREILFTIIYLLIRCFLWKNIINISSANPAMLFIY